MGQSADCSTLTDSDVGLGRGPGIYVHKKMFLLSGVSVYPLPPLSLSALSRSERNPSEETPDTAATLFS